MPMSSISDFVYGDGRAVGSVAEHLAANRFDPNLFRPYVDERGNKVVTFNTGRMETKRITVNGSEQDVRVPIYDTALLRELVRREIAPITNASLTKDAWIQLDQAIEKVARPRLRAWGDLAAASSYGGFDGFAHLTLEHQLMSDPGEAIVDMDGDSEGRHDSPLFGLKSTPLPIIHSSFRYGTRLLEISRRTGAPLDTVGVEAAGERVAEMVEKILIGIETGLTFGTNPAEHTGTSTIYGYLNFPYAITSVGLTNPTTGGWNGGTLVDEVLEMREALTDNNQFGPFMIYTSTDWDKVLDDDYLPAGGNNPNTTLRQRLRQIEGITDVRRLDYLTAATNPWTFIMVSLTSKTARAINGMSIKTLQWDSHGGMRRNFKVMAIMVPELRHDYNGSTGLLIATA